VREKRVEIQTKAMIVTSNVWTTTELSALSVAAVKQWSALLSPLKNREGRDVITTPITKVRWQRISNAEFFPFTQTILEDWLWQSLTIKQAHCDSIE
jgi:hypothetical protein